MCLSFVFLQWFFAGGKTKLNGMEDQSVDVIVFKRLQGYVWFFFLLLSTRMLCAPGGNEELAGFSFYLFVITVDREDGIYM